MFYLSFFQDWGPLNMAMVYRACILMHELLEVQHAIFFCGATTDLEYRIRTCYRMGSFFTPLVIHERKQMLLS